MMRFLAFALCLLVAPAFAAWHSVLQVSVGSAPATAIAFSTLANGTVGGAAIAGSGTYTGTAPSSLSSATWGGGCSGSSTVGSFSASAGSWSATFTVPGSSGSGCTIAITDNLGDSATSPGVTISGSSIALVAHVQTVQATPSSAINTTGATLLVIAQGGSTAVGCCSTPTDSKSNTWTALTQQTATGPGLACNIYYAVNPTVGSGHTFTSGGGGVGLIQVMAFSGVNTVAPFDTGKENGASVNVATSSITSGGGFTPSVNNAVIIARLTSDSGSATTLIDGGFTITDSSPLVGGVNYSGGGAYLVQTSAAAANPSWSWSPPTTATGCSKLAAFVP